MVEMALNLKSPEADRLARDLAAATHESLTDAVIVALRERLARVRDQQGPDMTVRLRRLSAWYTSLPVEDPRPADQIIGYDEHGLPA
jgi:antitoxin VapB